MMNAPIITSDKAYKHRCADTAFWQPYVSCVLQRHDLAVNGSPITAGFNSTYPVFITDDLVIKFFGYRNNWQAVFKNEMAAHRCLATNPDIKAPQIIASGELFEDSESPWAYSIARRIPGNSWLNTQLTRKQQIDLVKSIGQQLKLIHDLPINDQLQTDHNWSTLDLKAAAKQSVLPNHLIAQIADFIAQLDPFDKVFVNSDIVAMHVFVNNAQLSGIIDWGDATVADRHYELGKLCLEFPGDKELLTTFINASNWPVNKNFARQALGLAIYRQAVGLTQHNTFDVFYKIPDVLPLDEITNLDELADQLFNVN